MTDEKEAVNNERQMLALETKKLAKLKDMQREIESTAPLVKAHNAGQQADVVYMQPASIPSRSVIAAEKKKKAADFYFTKGAKGSEVSSAKVDFMAREPSPEKNLYAAKRPSPMRGSGKSPINAKGNGGGFQYDYSSTNNSSPGIKKGTSPTRV